MTAQSPPLRFLGDGPRRSRQRLVLAPGAGLPMDSPFMTAVACGLAAEGLRIERFDFPFMRRSRLDGRRRPPDAGAILAAAWRDAVAERGGGAQLIIGGKSMGGRIASQVADELGVRGLVCLGFPFHPPGRPDRLRLQDLGRIATPTLIVQGTRDALGAKHEVAGYTLSPAVRLVWIEDGDHSLVPRKRSGRTTADNLAAATAAVADFARGL